MYRSGEIRELEELNLKALCFSAYYLVADLLKLSGVIRELEDLLLKDFMRSQESVLNGSMLRMKLRIPLNVRALDELCQRFKFYVKKSGR
ncbi:hypothetical protein SUGI_0861710 [Cryptomeria japonica]|nr:hypothetical protein SUGI_0861710 [Cryptomeria japonica]